MLIFAFLFNSAIQNPFILHTKFNNKTYIFFKIKTRAVTGLHAWQFTAYSSNVHFRLLVTKYGILFSKKSIHLWKINLTTKIKSKKKHNYVSDNMLYHISIDA